MKLLFDIPENIKDAGFVYFVPFDLDSASQNIAGYIGVTKTEIITFENGTEAKKLSLADLDELKVGGLNGCGEITAKINDGTVLLLARFTLVHINRLGELCKCVTAFKRDGIFYKTDDDGDNICPKCGAVIPETMSVCTNCSKKSVMIKKLFTLSGKKNNIIFLLSSLIFAVASILTALAPLFNRMLVDDYLEPKNYDLKGIGFICALMFVSFGLAQIFRLIAMLLTNKASFHLQATLRRRCMDKIHKLSMASINKKTTGDLMTRIMSSALRVRMFLTDNLHFLLTQILTLICIFTIMFITDWALTLFVLLPLPIVFIAIVIYQRIIRTRFSRQWRLSSKCNIVLNDILKGMRVVKTFGKEKEEIERFDEPSAKLRNISAENEKIWAFLFPVILFFITFGRILVLYFGGYKVLDSTMSTGELVQFIMYLAYVYGPLMFWARIPRAYAEFISHLSKILELTETPDFASDKGIKADGIRGDISFKGLNFGYKAYEPVLKNISADIKAGEMIGIVGPSGVGKSTMINLLLRLYEPNLGSVEIDGKNLKNYDIGSVRDRIGIVFQDTFLFAGTIYDNIAYAKENATFEQVLRASKTANAHEFIANLPDGYETVIGENGHTLSGGERQRISIARAILKDPKILLLDEATSSLDTETERKIQDALGRLVKGRTTIAIAHRLSTLQNADRLIVLNDGMIKETGSHTELMRLRGIYYNLVMAQKVTTKLTAEHG